MPKHINVVFNKEKAEEPAEIRIYSEIGDDPWGGEMFSASDFADALSSIPRSRALNIRVNSPGGNVWDGMAMKSLLDAWPAKKTLTIDGVAASTASWFALGCDEVKMAEHGQMFIHDAWAFCAGNADDLRSIAENLDKTSGQIAELYANKCGRSVSEMRDKMRDGTLLTGKECKDLGLVDSLTSDKPASNFCNTALARMRERLVEQRNLIGKAVHGAANKDKAMKQKLLAMLAAKNVTSWDGNPLNEDTPDDVLEKAINSLFNAPKKGDDDSDDDSDEDEDPKDVAELKAQVNALKALNETARKSRIETEVQGLVDSDRIPANSAPNYIATILALPENLAEKHLQELKNLTPKPPGPLPVPAEIRADAAPQDILRGFEKFNEATNSWMRGNSVNVRDIGAAAVNKARFFEKHVKNLLPMFNTNTVPAALQRQAILQVMIRDFRRRLLPVTAYATKFDNVPLEGTNKVNVPFYDLDTSASTNFVLATGYTTVGDTTTSQREIAIGTGATQGARKYQALAFNSEEMARQPFLKIMQLGVLKAEKLALDIHNDILSVVTAANYGAAAITKAAAAFNSDDLADLKVACKTWPETGRSLILDSAYDGSLLKDVGFKFALNAASDSAVKEGRLYPRVYGYDYIEIPTIPTNGQNLVGFAVFQSAILVATAPVPPVEEVRNSGTTYEVVTDPQTGMSFEYRTFGNNVTDTGTHTIECSYGYAKGNGNALKRIVSP